MARWTLLRTVLGEAVSAAPPRAGCTLLRSVSQHTQRLTFATGEGLRPLDPQEAPRPPQGVRGNGGDAPVHREAPGWPLSRDVATSTPAGCVARQSPSGQATAEGKGSAADGFERTIATRSGTRSATLR